MHKKKSPENLNISRILLFRGNLKDVGGAERLMLEEAINFTKNRISAHVLLFEIDKKSLFSDRYNNINIHCIGLKENSDISFSHLDTENQSRPYLSALIYKIKKILLLRKKIQDIDPDIIILAGLWDCIFVYFATLFTKYSYATHIHGSIFWHQKDLIKYTLIHRKAFKKIINSHPGYMNFIPLKIPSVSAFLRIMIEIRALLTYFAVRKAKKIFVLSNQMKWEVKKTYSKEAIVLKGAFPESIFSYKPKSDMRSIIGYKEKRIILNINRLEKTKRVDLLIKAFKYVSYKYPDVILLIGGRGSEKAKLKSLVRKLNLSSKIKFLGYIPDKELWNYISACDVFVHPDWAEFDIAPYEALALGKKVVWANEMETDDYLKDYDGIFSSRPRENDFALAIEKALMTKVTKTKDLHPYTWENYCKKLLEILNT